METTSQGDNSQGTPNIKILLLHFNRIASTPTLANFKSTVHVKTTKMLSWNLRNQISFFSAKMHFQDDFYALRYF